MGCCEILAKIVLGTINLIFFLGSGLMLAFGITAKVDPDSITKIFNYLIPELARKDVQEAGISITSIIVSNSTFMIVVGAVGVAIAIIGFVGACCLVKWMLVIYAILLIILLLGEIALIIFAAVFTETFKEFIQDNMKKTLVDSFNTGIRVNATGSVMLPSGGVELGWLSVQLKEKCCGAKNWTDYSTFKWNNTNLIPSYPGGAVVPISCCTTKNDDFPPTINSFNDVNQCLSGNPIYINNQNCIDAVSDEVDLFIDNYKGIAIGIAAGIAGLALILIVLAIILACRSDRDGLSEKYA